MTNKPTRYWFFRQFFKILKLILGLVLLVLEIIKRTYNWNFLISGFKQSLPVTFLYSI